MKRFVLLALLAAPVVLAAPAADAGGTYVRGYTRSDGTYVAPHHRSSPDGSTTNNWSVSPNVNPYTGERGTRSPSYGGHNSGYGCSYSSTC